VAIYGFIERLLIPFGLHHVWNVPFFFQIGSFVDPITGETVTGDINRFFAGDPTAGIIGRSLLVQDVWSTRCGDRHVALRQAPEPQAGRRYHALRCADILFDGHYRTD
jgi:phosphotransferase system  glucose/maltose/N-acetylglucosamine-specific IIC component